MADRDLAPPFVLVFFDRDGLIHQHMQLQLKCPVAHSRIAEWLCSPGNWPEPARSATAIMNWCPGNAGPLVHRFWRPRFTIEGVKL